MRSVLPLAGMVPLSTCDWEGKLVSTVFTQGCPLACVFCHNPALIPFNRTANPSEITWASVIEHLTQRQGLLDGLVISGGEPCAHHSVLAAAEEVKQLGFLVGLHTSGAYPQRVQALLEAGIVDWVGLDVKTAPARYRAVAGIDVGLKTVETLKILTASMLEFEIRTTVHPSFFTVDDARIIGALLSAYGVKEWIVQKVRNEGTVRQDFTPVLNKWVDEIAEAAKQAGLQSVKVR